jgi:hypothetical protein
MPPGEGWLLEEVKFADQELRLRNGPGASMRTTGFGKDEDV